MSGKVYHDCPNAANPYHECNHRCLERISSRDVSNKNKKTFIFGKPLWRKECPISPAHAVPGNKSPLSSYYAKRMVESDESPSFSSSDDTFNVTLFIQRSPLHQNKADSGKNQLITTSSLAEYCKEDSFAFKFDHHEREAPIHYGVDTEMSPRTRPKTPEHPLRTPQHSTLTSESRPMTSEHRSNTTNNSIAPENRHRKTHEYRSNITDSRPRKPEHSSVALGPRPKAPDTRPRTEERKARSPGSSKQLSKTSKPQKKYHEPLRSETPETKARTPESKTQTEEYRERPPDYRARNPRPKSRVLKTQEVGQVDESESISDNNFTYLDDHEDDSSVNLYLEIKRICEREEETQSMMSESYISVGSYKVRANVSASLQQIFDKHGDIASDSKLESLTTRSYFLETLAEVVLELQSTPLKQLKVTRVLEMLEVVEDIESVKIRAGWLRKTLNEILDASRHYDQHKAMVMEKKMCEQDTMTMRQDMEIILKDMRVKEKEAKKLREGLMETAGRLGELEMKRERLEKSMAFLSSKVDKLEGGSALEKLI